MSEAKFVSRAVRKKDAQALVTGKPVYTGDLVPAGALTVKLLRSPHARAWIEEIDCTAAMKIPGVVAIYTWQDVPQSRFTTAGQTYPEPSPQGPGPHQGALSGAGAAAGLHQGQG